MLCALFVGSGCTDGGVGSTGCLVALVDEWAAFIVTKSGGAVGGVGSTGFIVAPVDKLAAFIAAKPRRMRDRDRDRPSVLALSGILSVLSGILSAALSGILSAALFGIGSVSSLSKL